ncbi:hypothetical protein TSUD_61040 [Trifolium subterraneum]|uniref:RNase H type-1 domain-containing protein n=1 Tax=Trifolium subterraneum TaxID=3900 RepID=A0A2Z6MW21_TRISU|nr:hypothetical protein TSUD_61040 [Trifolium subterraneum]
MKVVILLVEWLCYSGAFGTIVMISFGMIMSKCHVKLEDMLLMLGMIGTQYISYRVIMEWDYRSRFGRTSMGLCFRDNSGHFMAEADLVRWEKPALDWVKCNIDVAFVPGSGRTSMGLCFRDNSGHFMAGMTQWQQTMISSVEGEAWALLLAMEEARYKVLDRVQFESDSKVLIEAIHMKRRGNSEFLSIVHDILSLMSSFINFKVKFVRRQANLVAHTLARATNSWASFHRFENIPFCIERLVFNEMQ